MTCPRFKEKFISTSIIYDDVWERCVSWVKAVCAESVWVWTGLFDFSLSFLAFFVDLAKARLQHTPPDVQ